MTRDAVRGLREGELRALSRLDERGYVLGADWLRTRAQADRYRLEDEELAALARRELQRRDRREQERRAGL